MNSFRDAGDSWRCIRRERHVSPELVRRQWYLGAIFPVIVDLITRSSRALGILCLIPQDLENLAAIRLPARDVVQRLLQTIIEYLKGGVFRVEGIARTMRRKIGRRRDVLISQFDLERDDAVRVTGARKVLCGRDLDSRGVRFYSRAIIFDRYCYRERLRIRIMKSHIVTRSFIYPITVVRTKQFVGIVRYGRLRFFPQRFPEIILSNWCLFLSHYTTDLSRPNKRANFSSVEINAIHIFLN